MELFKVRKKGIPILERSYKNYLKYILGITLQFIYIYIKSVPYLKSPFCIFFFDTKVYCCQVQVKYRLGSEKLEHCFDRNKKYQ